MQLINFLLGEDAALRERNLYLWIALIFLLLNVGDFGLVESSDARYGEIGRAMFESGDYLHPNLLGVHHYHKPPITYQITALGISIFGVNAFGARFFLQLACVLQMWLVFRLSYRFIPDKKLATTASLMFFCMPILLIASRNLTTDMYLSLFTLAAVCCWIENQFTKKPLFLYLSASCLALAFLTKGPVVFIFYLPFIVAYKYIYRSKWQFNPHVIFSILLFIILGGSWYFLLVKSNPMFWDYFIGDQTVDRFAKKSTFNRNMPFWYFILLLPLMSLPWSLAFLNKFFRKWNTSPTSKLMFYSVLIPLMIFSISSSKRLLYILPFFGFLSIWLAIQWSQIDDRWKNKLCFGFAAFIGIVLLIVPLVYLLPYNTPVIMSCLGIILLTYASSMYKFAVKGGAVQTAFATSLILTLSMGVFMQENQFAIRANQPLTEWILNNHLQHNNVMIYNTRKPSVNFGLNKNCIFLYDDDPNLNRETQFETNENWKKYLYNLSSNDECIRLRNKMQEESILLVHKNSPLWESACYLMKDYRTETTIGPWTVYHN